MPRGTNKLKTVSIFKLFLFAMTGVVCFLAGGCMVGPDYSRPATTAGGAESFVNVSVDSVDPNGVGNVGQWWRRFGDPVLGDLVAAALENNTDLRAAAGRVVEARALLRQSHGIRLPDVSYSASRVRIKSSFTSPFGGRESFFATTYSQDFSVSYLVDFFGKLKRSERAAFSDLLGTEASEFSLVHSIIAQVVLSRIETATQQGLLNIARADTESRRQTLEIIERRYRSGRVGPLDVHLARENLAASESYEPRVEQALILARHSLDVLVGRRPAELWESAATLPDVSNFEPIPVGMPASLLDRRPDVRSSEFRLRAATERIGVSIAEMFPDLTLTATGGYRSDFLSDITKKDGEVYTAIIGLAAPLYKGGQLKAGVEAARARTEQAEAEYAGTVLTALREVEDALVSERLLKERIEKLSERLKEALSAESLALERYSKGLEKLLIVLETQRRRRTAENEFVTATSALWNARVNLFLALGGDWEVEPMSVAQSENKGTNDG